MSGCVWTPKPDTPLQDSLYQKKPLFNKLQSYENTVNYKRKLRHRFFLLMRSRTPPISSEFRGGGLNPPQYPTGAFLLNLHSNPLCWHNHQNKNTVAHCNWSNDMITNAQNRFTFFSNGTELIWPSKALVKTLYTLQLISTKRACAVIAVHAIKALRRTEVYFHTFLT